MRDVTFVGRSFSRFRDGSDVRHGRKAPQADQGSQSEEEVKVRAEPQLYKIFVHF